MEDNRIIELFFERSEQAITELSEKYGAVLKRIAMNILNDPSDSEECLNDAYLGVWNSIPPQRPDHLLSYICRIVKNLAIKRYHSNTAKKRNSSYDLALEEIKDFIPSPYSTEDELAAKEAVAILNSFLDTLDHDDRVMFVRRYWYGDNITDIAELFGKSNHYISVRLSRIHKALEKYYREKGTSK